MRKGGAISLSHTHTLIRIKAIIVPDNESAYKYFKVATHTLWKFLK